MGTRRSPPFHSARPKCAVSQRVCFYLGKFLREEHVSILVSCLTLHKSRENIMSSTSVFNSLFSFPSQAICNIVLILFFLIYLLIMLLQLSHFPPSLPSALHTPSLPHSPPIVHVHGSCISVLWLLHFLYYSYPPPVYFLPTTYATYSLCLSPLSPPPTPLLITLQHCIDVGCGVE